MTEQVGAVDVHSTEGATIFVCITCRASDNGNLGPPAGARLAAAAAQAAQNTGITVQAVRCLANCARGPSAAIRCGRSWTYVFGGLDVACAAALIEGARLLLRAKDGLLPWRGRPEPLKRGLIARVPPLDFTDLVDSLSPLLRGEGRGEGQSVLLASAPHPNPLPVRPPRDVSVEGTPANGEREQTASVAPPVISDRNAL